MAKRKAKQDTNSYEVITQVDEETGDLLVPLPPELLSRMGWKIGTDVDIQVDKSGRIIIKENK